MKGTPIYLVPRADGQLVVGASSEEAGFDRRRGPARCTNCCATPSRSCPNSPRRSSRRCAPGCGPGSPDNAPIIGPSGLAGLIHATGHYRNGILLAAVTADGVAELITTGGLPDALAPFAPTRFAQAVPA